MKITTVLFVDTVEPVLPFWVDRLGFQKTVEVPDENGLVFVILQHGAAELMIQTRKSAEKDVPGLGDLAAPRAGTFIEVENFDNVLSKLDGLEVVLPERTTWYGMREILVREPGGNVVCFASRV
jgi:hypothetical protein